MSRVLVVGAGIAGLSAAEALSRLAAERGRTLEVRVYDAETRAGGKIQTDRVEDFVIERGPHGFLDKEPKMTALIDRLGLAGELVRADRRSAHRYVVRRGKLRRLPEKPPEFLFSSVLPFFARLRVLLEPFARKAPAEEESVYAFTRRRMGKAAADVLIDAMVTGVYGGDPKAISVSAAFPKVKALEAQYGGLIKGQVALAKTKSAGGPVGELLSFREGLGTLLQALAARTEVQLERRIDRVERVGKRYRLVGDGFSDEGDAVLFALPAFEMARLFGPYAPDEAEQLNQIPYASIAVLVEGFLRDVARRPLNGFGFLVPHQEGRSILGSIWASSVFPEHAPSDALLLRTMLGGARAPDLLTLDDETLTVRARADLDALSGIPETAPFRVRRLIRWERGIPQYTLGHAGRRAAALAIEAKLPGIVLGGNALNGVALIACVADAEPVATRVLDALDRLV